MLCACVGVCVRVCVQVDILCVFMLSMYLFQFFCVCVCVRSFANLGIQCVRRKELDASLQKRRSQNIDPFISKRSPVLQVTHGSH